MGLLQAFKLIWYHPQSQATANFSAAALADQDRRLWQCSRMWRELL
jgi:hypothetical protein